MWEGLHPAVYHMYMSDFMKRWNESDEKVRVWTVNNEKDMKNFIQHDLEAVITNYPDVALASKKRGNRMLSNKAFLFDIDGTVCQGERLIDGTNAVS